MRNSLLFSIWIMLTNANRNEKIVSYYWFNEQRSLLTKTSVEYTWMTEIYGFSHSGLVVITESGKNYVIETMGTETDIYHWGSKRKRSETGKPHNVVYPATIQELINSANNVTSPYNMFYNNCRHTTRRMMRRLGGNDGDFSCSCCSLPEDDMLFL